MVSAGDPFNNLTTTDAPEGCMLKPCPNQTVPTMVSSFSCDAVCCDGRQPHCPLAGAPGFDTARWVADAKAKMAGLVLRLFYGCSHVFHLSGDNSRDRCIKGSCQGP